MRRLQLREFIEIVLPTRNRSGRALSAVRLRRWKQLLTAYLLDDLKVTGFQESKREGVWRQERRDSREYDPRTDLVSVVREEVHVLRTSCTRAQLHRFRSRGEALLIEMGRAFDQEAVAYETRNGLVVLFLS